MWENMHERGLAEAVGSRSHSLRARGAVGRQGRPSGLGRLGRGDHKQSRNEGHRHGTEGAGWKVFTVSHRRERETERMGERAAREAVRRTIKRREHGTWGSTWVPPALLQSHLAEWVAKVSAEF